MTETASNAKRQRTCVACGSKQDKLSYLRFVRAKDGSVSFDATGRVAGRGAYVCSAKCFESAIKSRKLQRALKTNIGEADALRLAAEIGSAESVCAAR